MAVQWVFGSNIGMTTCFDDRASCWLSSRLTALQMGGTDEDGWYSKNGALIQRSKEICLKRTGKSDRDESSFLVFARRKIRKYAKVTIT